MTRRWFGGYLQADAKSVYDVLFRPPDPSLFDNDEPRPTQVACWAHYLEPLSCNDVERDEPQDIGSPFGKILRLDPGGMPPYAAAGNPFARGGDPRVYHYGLRNPYNWSFDRDTGDLYIGDVGQNSCEEADYAPRDMAGLNFGWAAFEVSPTPGRTVRGEPTPHPRHHSSSLIVVPAAAAASSAIGAPLSNRRNASPAK